MSVFARFGEVLSPDGARPAFVTSVVGRLSLGMTGLALLLMVKGATGSYASAGLVSAAYAASFAVGAPSRARAADRDGPCRVLRLCGILHPLALLAVVVLVRVDAPVAVLVAGALPVGLTVPPLGSVMRALWGTLLPGRELTAAYALESVAVETCFVVGPLLVGALSAGIDPAAAVLSSAVLAGAGALVLSGLGAVRAVVPHDARPTSAAGPLVSPVVRALLLNVLFIGAGFGTIEVAVPAFIEEHGSRPAAAGVVLAVWSVGSILGGLVYGGLHLRARAGHQLPVLVAAVGLGALLPVLSPGVIALALLLAVSGSTIAPFSACNSVLLGGSAPAGTVTEAFAWNGSMIFGGAAVGSAVAGILVEVHGARAALMATAVTGLLVWLSSWLGLAALRAQGEGAGEEVASLPAR